MNDAFKPASKFPFSTPLIIPWSSLSFSVSSFRMWMPHWYVVFCSLTINRAHYLFSLSDVFVIHMGNQRFYQHAKGWGLTIPFTVDPAKVCGCSHRFWRLEAFSNPNPRSVLRKICRPTTFLPPYFGFGSQSSTGYCFLGKTVLYRTWHLVSKPKSHVRAKNMKPLGCLSHFLPRESLLWNR